MEIYPLLYFQTIAETGNLTRAAEALDVSRNTVRKYL